MTKLVTIEEAVPSDQFQFGGEILNQIVLLLSGSALDSQEDIKLDTTFKFYSGRFALVEEDPTHAIKIIFKVENIDTGGDKTITYRNPTVTNDFAVTEKQIQVLENKVLGTNTQVSAPMDFNSNAIVEAILDGDLNTFQDIPSTAITSLAYTKLTGVPDIHGPFTFTIYQTATQYIVKNNHTGIIQSFSNSDFAPALIWAVNNVVNVGLGTQSSLYGGTIFLERGKYIATTTIAPTITTALRHGIAIIGEEWGTEINFNPPSGTPLTDGFLIDMAAYSLKNIRVTANQYVTNLIHLIGHSGGANRRNDHFFLQGLQVEGPNGNAGWATLPPISGQIGILIDGTNIACYYSTIKDCKIHSFEKGIWFKGLHATSVFCKDNSIKWCETGIEVSDSSGQLQIDGAWIQGDYFAGTTGIKIASTAGGYIYIDHITSEMRRTDNGHAIAPTSDGTPIPCQTVLIETGIGNCYIGKHITNAYDGAVGWTVAKTIVNNSTQVNHTPLNWGWKSKNFFTLDPDNDLVTLDANRRMAIRSGMFYLQQSNGFNYIFSQTGALAASRVVNMPVLLGPDQVTFDNHITALAGKTIDSITNTVKNISSFKYMIFKSGTTYYCRNNITGAIDISNTSPNTVLQYPLTQGGSVYIQSGDYFLTGNPSIFFDFPVEPLSCHIEMAPDARIVVPAGYTGIVFRMKNTATAHCTENRLIGGKIEENNTIAKNWIGILLESTGNNVASKGTFNNTIRYTKILWPDIGIKLNCDTDCDTGFTSFNFFEDMYIGGAKTAFVDFGMDDTFIGGGNGVNRNRFTNLVLQNSNIALSVTGFRNVRHRENSFYGCYVVDFGGSNIAGMTIHADATDTEILGGTVDTYQFVNNGVRTKMMTETNGLMIDKIKPSNGTNFDIFAGNDVITTSWYKADVSERFYIQKNATDYRFDFVRQTAGGSLKPVLFRQMDVVGGGAGTVESFRIETDAALRVYTNKLKLLDLNQSHKITVTVPDITADYNLAIPPLTGNDTFMTAGTLAINDSTISSHTSTKISITNKGQLNSQIAYKDDPTWLTNAMVAAAANLDWTKINKTGSVLSDISNVVLTTPADQDILVRNSAGNWVNLAKGTNNRFLMISAGGLVSWAFVGDINIATHTTTKISVTNKALLNSQIAYKDETGWITESMAQQTPNLFTLIKLPTWGKKKGGFQGTSSGAGWGIIGTLTALGTFVALDVDTTYGTYVPRATGAVAGNNAGWSYSNALTMRKFNPILAVLLRTSHVALNRMYIGWKSTAASPTALTDDPLASLSGVMFLQRSGDTTWQICSNNGGASSTIVNTTAPISATIPSNLQIRGDDANSKWQYSIDGGTTWIDVTGNFPAQTTKLFYVGESQTNEAVIHNLHTFTIEIASDK